MASQGLDGNGTGSEEGTLQYSTDKLVVSIQYGLSEAMNEIIRSRMVDNDSIKCADISAGEFAWYKLNKG